MVKRRSLHDIFNKGNVYSKRFVTRLNDSLIWTNSQIAVKDDPNFQEYFGAYVLRNLIREGGVYALGSHNKRLIIEGEHRGSSLAEQIQLFFNQSLSSHVKLSVPEREVFVDGCRCLVTGDESAGVLVDDEYYEYLDRLGFDELHFCEPSSQGSSIYFGREGVTRAILAPLRSEKTNAYRVSKEQLREIDALA